MAWSALRFSSNALYQAVNQVAHGFVAGDIVVFDGTSYVLSQADDLLFCAGSMMVSNVINADSFYVTQVGFVSNLPGPYAPGISYYVSPTNPGELVSTRPTAVGDVILECFTAVTSTSGYFWGGYGQLIESGPLFDWTVVTLNTSMAVNKGYIINGVGSLNMLLPATSAVGDVIEIATLGTNGCVITQNAGQSINIVDDTSTVGAGGMVTLQVTNGVLSGGIRLVCLVANTTWKGTPGSGVWNPT